MAAAAYAKDLLRRIPPNKVEAERKIGDVLSVGSGKSVVTAAAINDLICKPRENKDNLAYFICEHDNASSLTARTILGSLIRQCLSVDTLSKAVEDKLKILFRGTSPDAEDLEPLLKSAVATSRISIFVIDGIDECVRVDGILILKMLHRLTSSSQSIVKLFFSSRDDMVRDITRIFRSYQPIAMDCAEARTDIPMYVNGAIAEKIENGDLSVGSGQLVQDIRDALMKGANGMFLWVTLQLEDLCRKHSDAEIRHSLKILPKDLPETYERVLMRIINEDNDEIANRIFCWVAIARRPLQLDELREALATELGDIFLRKDRLASDINRLISYCGSLLVVDEDDLIVQFAHHTVKVFLLSERYSAVSRPFFLEPAKIDHMAGEICVTYLNFSDFQQQVIPKPKTPETFEPKGLLAKIAGKSKGRIAEYGLRLARIATKNPGNAKFNVLERLHQQSTQDSSTSQEKRWVQYPFLAYARNFWLSHTAGFRQENTPTWSLWAQLVLADHPFTINPWKLSNGQYDKESMVQYILDESHFALIIWLRDHEHSGEKSLDPSDLLIKASRKGNPELVDFILDSENIGLLNAGADVNAVVDIFSRRSRSCTALQAAAKGGHLEIVELLIRANADVNASPARSNGRTALQAAAEGGHLELVERLLAANADINAPRGKLGGRAALEAAVAGGHLTVVERLLAAKPDSSIPALTFGLQAALRGGYLDVINVIERFLTPIDIVRIYVKFERDFPSLRINRKTSLHTHTLLSRVGGTRTAATQGGPHPDWHEILYIPVRDISEKFIIEIIDQVSIPRDWSVGLIEFSASELMNQAQNSMPPAFSANQQLTMSKNGLGKVVSHSDISFFRCLNIGLVTVTTRLQMNSRMNWPPQKLYMPAEKLFEYESGLIMLRFLGYELSRTRVQLQIFVDEMALPSYVSSITPVQEKELYDIRFIFIRELPFSQLTLQLRESTTKPDPKKGIVAKFTGNTNNPTNMKLEDKHGLVGTIKISMDYIPINMLLDPSESINNMGKLHVYVLDAIDLSPANRNGYSDPFCVFELNDETVYKTGVQKKTLHPAWNEAFDLNITSRTASKFQCKVFSSNFTSDPSYLGGSTIDIKALELFTPLEVSLILDLKSGAIRLRLHFVPDYIPRISS
ncbi:hypothetical protein F5884DRAFT_858319 [Xylogone sp. PMI_703]|nr:hypothetical protein F5884DRAFT_858319 [Xylogone sp. PMI_703]